MIICVHVYTGISLSLYIYIYTHIGTTWGQHVRAGSSFVDPKTGLLAGPWAECVAWAAMIQNDILYYTIM